MVFLIGFMAGGFFGVLVYSALVVGRIADDNESQCFKEDYASIVKKIEVLTDAVDNGEITAEAACDTLLAWRSEFSSGKI